MRGHSYMGKRFGQYSVPEDGFVGEGTYSDVYRVVIAPTFSRRTTTTIQRAMKVIDSDATVVNELAVLIRLEHASNNVVKYYDHFDVNVRGETDLKSGVNLCVIIEYCEVNLFSLLGFFLRDELTCNQFNNMVVANLFIF